MMPIKFFKNPFFQVHKSWASLITISDCSSYKGNESCQGGKRRGVYLYPFAFSPGTKGKGM